MYTLKPQTKISICNSWYVIDTWFKYRRAGKFQGRNFHGSVRSNHFLEKTSWNAKIYHRWVRHVQTFTGGSKIMKFVNFFSLKKFLLYGTSSHNYACLWRSFIPSTLELTSIFVFKSIIIAGCDFFKNFLKIFTDDPRALKMPQDSICRCPKHNTWGGSPQIAFDQDSTCHYDQYIKIHINQASRFIACSCNAIGQLLFFQIVLFDNVL